MTWASPSCPMPNQLPCLVRLVHFLNICPQLPSLQSPPGGGLFSLAWPQWPWPPLLHPPPSSQIDFIKRESDYTLPLLKAFQ